MYRGLCIEGIVYFHIVSLVGGVGVAGESEEKETTRARIEPLTIREADKKNLKYDDGPTTQDLEMRSLSVGGEKNSMWLSRLSSCGRGQC